MSLTSASSTNSWNRPMAFDPPPTHASRMSGLPPIIFFIFFHKNSAIEIFEKLGGLPMSLTSASSTNSWKRPMAFDPPPTHASRMSGLPTYKSDISIVNKLMEETDGI